MGWWIALGILVFLAILPLGASVRYDADGVVVRLIIGGFQFTIIPMKKKDKKPKKTKALEPAESEPQAATQAQEKAEQQKQEKAEKKKKEKSNQKEKPGGPITDFLPLVKLALKFVGDFFGKLLHIDVLYLKLTLGGGDPADLAMNYGKAWAALGNLWPKIDKMFTIKKRDIQLQCDFEASQTLVNARVDITLTLGRLFGLIFSYGFKIILGFLKIQSKRKKAAEAAENYRKINQTQTT